MDLLTTLRHWLAEENLDGVLIASRQNKQSHLGMATGSGYVLVTRAHAHILVDFRYFSDIASRVVGYQMHLLDIATPFAVAVNRIITDEHLATLGFEGEHVSWQTGMQWGDTLKATLRGISLDALRQIKTVDEIARIRAACGIADSAAQHIRRFIQPGMREREVAAELEWYMKQQGADNPAFDTIVASGHRGALPHGKATDKVIAPGELVTVDFGVQRQGYCSDMTRTFLVAGHPRAPDKHPLYAVYQIVLEAQLAALRAIRPGIPCHQVDNAARRVIENAGYGPQFGHNTGHAIGIEVHENPRFSPTDATLIQPGMLLTVEPGIYLAGQGGVRIEDMVLVTETGAEVLYTMEKSLLLTGER
jgi:aminopeptidase